MPVHQPPAWICQRAPLLNFPFFSSRFVFREEPEADGDLCAVKKLAGEGDHAVHEVGLDEGAADLAFAGLVREPLI